MTGRGAQWTDSLRRQLWPLPVFAVAVAVFLGTALPVLDAGVDGELPRAFVETAMARVGAPDPVAAATAMAAVVEGMIIQRVAVDPDAEVFALIDAVVRAFLPRECSRASK
jgi:uncharacterized membrane protein